KSNGHLLVHVRGLVLAEEAPVPPALQGTNPIPDFEAIVSCQSIGTDGSAVSTNVATGQFAASADGNADINATVSLPSPCIAPIVFVASPTGAWFAATGSCDGTFSPRRRCTPRAGGHRPPALGRVATDIHRPPAP